MDTEKDIITLKEEIPKHDYFSLLILSGGLDVSREIKEVYTEPVEIQILVNGKQVMIKDFREVMQDWGNRIGARHKEKYDTLIKESTVEQHAQNLLKKKLNKYRSFIEHMEDLCEDELYNFEYDEDEE